jgi:hypothetical protein
MHAPLLHTWFVPQVVPLGRFPVSAQTDVPVTHDVAPVRQGLVGWQLAPAVQPPQMPLLQTLLVPQTVPLTRFAPLSAQVMVGEQAVKPAWHGLEGVQASPTVHATQAPLLQTRLVPQPVPFATFSDSTQTGAPVLQVIAPVRQGLPAMGQVAPAVQSPHVPAALQTLLVPQDVPAGTFVSASRHCGVPVVHDRVPLWQGLAGVQVAPDSQAAHCPLWHTIPVPQAVPFGWSLASVHTGAPVVQLIAPVRHGLPVTVQGVPAAHDAQLPLLQTRFVPQTVPLACASVVAVQTVPEVVQVVFPT